MISQKASSSPSSSTWVDQALPIPGLLLTSTVAFTLLGLKVNEWRGSERFAEFITNDRTTVAIAIQIVSHVLGLIQVQVLCTVIKSSFTASTASRTFSLNAFQFVHAASIPRVSFSLPWSLSMPLITLVLLSFFPSALWSGAITPILSEKVTSQPSMIPSFQTTNLSALWEGNSSTSTSGSGSLGQWLTADGLFSYDPSALRNLILNSASDASTTNSSGHLHQKLDKTGFLYLNRSYGVGAATGLIDVAGTSSPQWVSYFEPGFYSNVSCIYNASSAYRIDKLDTPSGWTLNVYQAAGSYPTGDSTGGWVYVGYSAMDIFSWGVIYKNKTRRSYVSLTTAANESQDAWSFSGFNNIQCQIDFEARNYSVQVNHTNSVISVTPKEGLQWPSYADAVIDEVTTWLWVFSYVDSSFGGSYLGRTLRLNVNQLQNATGDFSSDTTLRGVSDYLSSCVDNILVALSSARLVAANATLPVEASVGVPAVTFGETEYIGSILALNIFVCLLYAAEALRTRFWRNMPQLDLMDLTSVVLAAWKGGIGLVSGGTEDDVFGVDTAAKDIRVTLDGSKGGIPCMVPLSASQIIVNGKESVLAKSQR
ncbi:hypothetical protein PV08_08336 [Exophiala spinifera]|uniref:Uncharacterized protein n=1 Tax=Exophiala spinifera TaxID=91928 RepID=A0A0D2BPV2_9EURO|nr:uncharacterized protein PV08_08336 [Exophiala spinifera]KIW13149.1 hypothetical protein PV08_08336 [Exophiala spinifera]